MVNEQYGYGDYYFAVAVAKLNSTVTMKNLKGKKTCHTGAGKTSGWVVPIGFLLSKQYMKQDKSSCNPYISAGNYFKESCIPSKYNFLTLWFHVFTVKSTLLLPLGQQSFLLNFDSFWTFFDNFLMVSI